MQTIGQKIPKHFFGQNWTEDSRLGYNSELSDTFYNLPQIFLLLNKGDLPATTTNCHKYYYFSENPMKVALVLGRLQEHLYCECLMLGAFVCKKRMASVII